MFCYAQYISLVTQAIEGNRILIYLAYVRISKAVEEVMSMIIEHE